MNAATNHHFDDLQRDLRQKFELGELTIGHLAWFCGLSKEERDQLLTGKFTPEVNPTAWKTLHLARGLDRPGDVLQIIEAGGQQVSIHAKSLLNQPGFGAPLAPSVVNIVRFSVEEVGFSQGAEFGEFKQRLCAKGITPCSPRIAPALRMHYRDQPEGEEIHLFMEPILDDDGEPSVFSLLCDKDGQWLAHALVHPVRYLPPNSQWAAVFPG